MKTIGIIGGGFTGTMTAVQLIEKSDAALEINIINEKETLNRGVAYNPYSEKHLLNVITGKMSAYPDMPDHFLNWLMARPDFKSKDKTLIQNSFIPRKLFGEYMSTVWKNALTLAASKNIKVNVIDSFVLDLETTSDGVAIFLENGSKLSVDNCVIATGNHVPRNPKIENDDFYKSENYFQNSWKIESVLNAPDDLAVLIIGNGLTMVDTVLGLLENGFKGKMISISPNGFNILPHRHSGLKYSKLSEELGDDLSLLELVKLVNKHLKAVREYGVSAEPVIDSLRPHTQHIWRGLSEKDKQLFMSRIRHLWGVARHRIPLHSHDKIQQLRLDGRLFINSGRILNIVEEKNHILLTYFDKKDNVERQLKVSRIINCTGPETDLSKLEKGFLKNCFLKGMLVQDSLKLGITADIESFRVIDSQGNPQPHLFTLGSNLKGQLWESTAVNELRSQAEELAERLKAG